MEQWKYSRVDWKVSPDDVISAVEEFLIKRIQTPREEVDHKGNFIEK